MTCDKTILISLFGVFYFTGFIIGSISVLTLGDLYGRKPILMIATLASVFIYIGLGFANNLVFVYILMVLSGTITIAKFALGYLYMLELLPESKHIRYHIWINLAGVLFAVLSIIYILLVQEDLTIFIGYSIVSVAN